jgi:hypothetical protein
VVALLGPDLPEPLPGSFVDEDLQQKYSCEFADLFGVVPAALIP